jgi:phage terminase small subunit
MPALRNIRREKFCRNVLSGMSRPEAYEKAGYAAPQRQSAYRLMQEPEVKHRMIELLNKTETDVIISLETLTNAYVDILSAARDENDLKTAKGVLDSLGRMHGLVIERKEVGKAGDFARMTEHELIDFIEATAIEVGRTIAGSEDSSERAEQAEEEDAFRE